MKSIILFLLTINFAFGQSEPLKNNYIHNAISSKPAQIICKFDNDNNSEASTLEGIVIKKINDNCYWVKNGRLVNSDGKPIIDFGLILLKNNKAMISQIPAYYGYIIEIVKDKSTGKKNLLVSLANENGEKNSDELLIDTN